MSFDNVMEADGINVAVMGMLIVFCALTLISLFIAALPKVLDVLNDYLPAEHAHHAGHGGSTGNEQQDDEQIIAGLGFVLHHELMKQQSK